MRVYIGRHQNSKKVKGVWQDAKERKINIRIDKYDTWNMDHTLGLIILPMLKQVQKNKHGAPNTDDEDVPEEIRSTAAAPKENEYDTDEYHFNRWDWIMDEMIWAFTQIISDDDEDQFRSGTLDTLWQALDKDHNPIGEPLPMNSAKTIAGAEFYQMVDGPNHTYQLDMDGLKKHTARIQNGTRLFGKYYQGLWE
jgi:hypothetical protein